jgi:hypothetical protein
MTMSRYILRALCLLLIFLGASATFGQDGLALMKVEPGARPAGMGGAFVTVSGDANSAAYNPAGAVAVDRFTASVGHNTFWENIRLETGYVLAPLSRRTFLHGGIRVASVDDIEGRTAPTLEPETMFDSHDVSFKAGLAYQFTERLSAGFGAGWFVEKIGAWRGWTWNVDLGALYRHNDALAVGASVTNVGPNFQLAQTGRENTEDISLPLTYRVGGSYRYDRYLGALDLVVIDDKLRAHVGAEADLHELLSLRAGYMFNYDSKNFTAGATFTKRNFAIDYAFVPYSNDLGTSHLFNLTVTL